jgi:hypothetical protein
MLGTQQKSHASTWLGGASSGPLGEYCPTILENPPSLTTMGIIPGDFSPDFSYSATSRKKQITIYLY